jgi:membrane-associated protein
MEIISWFVDLILHLDDHLVELLRDYGIWVYLILFLIIFAETGLVVTPFLPGDSLLFAAGALAAVDDSHTLTPWMLSGVLIVAAITGNTTNYHIGRAIGPPAFSGRIRFLKVEYLRRTEAFFLKYGPMTIVLSRFAPILRTCAPFVAGVARMPYGRFQAYNVFGGLSWVLSFVWLGYFFGNLPVIKDNFGFVTIGIIVVSLLPVIVMALRKQSAVPPAAP